MLFSGFLKKTKQSGKKLLENMGAISKHSHKIKEAENQIKTSSKEIGASQIDLIHENSKDYYISYQDFLKLLDKDKLSFQDITAVCKHVSEISAQNASAIEVFATTHEKGILLTSERPEGYLGDKIKVVTIKYE